MGSKINAVPFLKARPPFNVAQLIYTQENFILEVTHNPTPQRGQEAIIELRYCAKALLIAEQIHREILGKLIGKHKFEEQQSQVAYKIAA